MRTKVLPRAWSALAALIASTGLVRADQPPARATARRVAGRQTEPRVDE